MLPQEIESIRRQLRELKEAVDRLAEKQEAMAKEVHAIYLWVVPQPTGVVPVHEG